MEERRKIDEIKSTKQKLEKAKIELAKAQREGRYDRYEKIPKKFLKNPKPNFSFFSYFL